MSFQQLPNEVLLRITRFVAASESVFSPDRPEYPLVLLPAISRARLKVLRLVNRFFNDAAAGHLFYTLHIRICNAYYAPSDFTRFRLIAQSSLHRHVRHLSVLIFGNSFTPNRLAAEMTKITDLQNHLGPIINRFDQLRALSVRVSWCRTAGTSGVNLTLMKLVGTCIMAPTPSLEALTITIPPAPRCWEMLDTWKRGSLLLPAGHRFSDFKNLRAVVLAGVDTAYGFRHLFARTKNTHSLSLSPTIPGPPLRLQGLESGSLRKLRHLSLRHTLLPSAVLLDILRSNWRWLQTLRLNGVWLEDGDWKAILEECLSMPELLTIEADCAYTKPSPHRRNVGPGADIPGLTPPAPAPTADNDDEEEQEEEEEKDPLDTSLTGAFFHTKNPADKHAWARLWLLLDTRLKAAGLPPVGTLNKALELLRKPKTKFLETYTRIWTPRFLRGGLIFRSVQGVKPLGRGAKRRLVTREPKPAEGNKKGCRRSLRKGIGRVPSKPWDMGVGELQERYRDVEWVSRPPREFGREARERLREEKKWRGIRGKERRTFLGDSDSEAGEREEEEGEDVLVPLVGSRVEDPEVGQLRVALSNMTI